MSRQQRARVDRRSEERFRCLLPNLDFQVGFTSELGNMVVHRGAAEPLFEPSQGSEQTLALALLETEHGLLRAQVPQRRG